MDGLSQVDVPPSDETGERFSSIVFGEQTTGKQTPDPAGMNQLRVARGNVRSKRSLTDTIAVSLALPVYVFFFLVGLLTLCLLEIRQANVPAFTSLVAALEEKDRAEDPQSGLKSVLLNLVEQRTYYSQFFNTINCSELGMIDTGYWAKVASGAAPGAKDILEIQHTDAPPSCEVLRETVKAHIRAVVAKEDEIRAKIANLGLWYHAYIDGINAQAPQIIPVLGLLKSHSVLRSPLEILEMTLLICAGVLGGIMSVTRFLIDTLVSRPSMGEFIWKPAMGGLIAFGTFILFRAGQLLLSAQPQDGAGASTSLFLLALVGLVSGLCAQDAIAQIEKASGRILRRGSPGAAKEQLDGDPGRPTPILPGAA